MVTMLLLMVVRVLRYPLLGACWGGASLLRGPSPGQALLLLARISDVSCGSGHPRKLPRLGARRRIRQGLRSAARELRHVAQSSGRAAQPDQRGAHGKRSERASRMCSVAARALEFRPCRCLGIRHTRIMHPQRACSGQAGHTSVWQQVDLHR